MKLSNLHVGDLIEQRYSDFEEGLKQSKMVFKTRKGIITYSSHAGGFYSVQWLEPFERGIIFADGDIVKISTTVVKDKNANVTLLSRAQEKENGK